MTWVLIFAILCATAIVITGMVMRHLDDDVIEQRAAARTENWLSVADQRLRKTEQEIIQLRTQWADFKEGK